MILGHNSTLSHILDFPQLSNIIFFLLYQAPNLPHVCDMCDPFGPISVAMDQHAEAVLMGQKRELGTFMIPAKFFVFDFT